VTRFDIAHVSSAHPWTDNRVHLREAAGLVNAGWRVFLVAVESDLAVPDTGVVVHTIRRRRRMTRVLLGSVEAVWAGYRSGAAVLHLHDPELVWAVPLLRVLGRRVVFDAHEDLPNQVLNKSYLGRSGRLVAKVAAHAVVWFARRADRIVAATETIADRFPPRKTVLVRNFPRIRAEDDIVTVRDPAVAFVGALDVDRGARTLARAVLDPAFPEGWFLRLAGPVRPAALLEGFREGVDRGRVELHGRVSPGDARDLLARSSIGVVTLLPTPAHLDCLPTKLFENMAAGLALVVSDFPLWRRLLRGYDCVTFVDPSDPAAIARAIAAYASDPDRLSAHSEVAARAAREEFHWDAEEAVLVDMYRGLLEDRHR
jgi:glycosyltransferase involved in cell wall biosynthesis